MGGSRTSDYRRHPIHKENRVNQEERLYKYDCLDRILSVLVYFCDAQSQSICESFKSSCDLLVGIKELGQSIVKLSGVDKNTSNSSNYISISLIIV